jgi:hypothetical protein
VLPWSVPAPVTAIMCANMIHIAPFRACEGLFEGAAGVLPAGGALVVYGPFKQGGAHTAESNARFDDMLRSQDPSWGVRDLDDVKRLAQGHGFRHVETIAMPANNLSVVFEKS